MSCVDVSTGTLLDSHPLERLAAQKIRCSNCVRDAPDTKFAGYSAFKKYFYQNSKNNSCLHFCLQHCSVLAEYLAGYPYFISD